MNIVSVLFFILAAYSAEAATSTGSCLDIPTIKDVDFSRVCFKISQI